MPYGIMPPAYPGASMPGYLPAEPVSPAGVPLADFGSRLIAYLIDSLLLGAVTAAVSIPVFFLASENLFSWVNQDVADNDTGRFVTSAILPLFAMELGLLVFSQVVVYLYAVELQFRTGQTIGKRIMKIRVVPLDPNLQLTRLAAVKRYAAEYLPAIVVGFYVLIDGLWQTWDRPYQQTLHDKAAQTVVVKVSA
jgi:uncharacterized RDD family membrane protein YckC